MGRYIVYWWIVAVSWGYSQNLLDAIRWSQTGFTGTARSMGLGGAVTALGADWGSAAVNPAGLGMFRKGEISITPAIHSITSNLTMLDQNNKSTKTNFNLTSWSFIIANPIYSPEGDGTLKTEGFKSWTFAFGYTNLANHHSRRSAVGFNQQNSVTDWLASISNGNDFNVIANPDNGYYYPYIAWWTYAIDTLAGSSSQYLGVANKANVEQQYYEFTSGKTSDWTIAFAGNWSDKIFVGLGINIRDLRFSYTPRSIKEKDINNVYPDTVFNPANGQYPFEELRLIESLELAGTGINVNFGVLSHVTDFLRIGFGIKSPSYVAVREEYGSRIEHVFADSLWTADIQGNFSYKLVMPFEVYAGAAMLLGKWGMISVDAFYKDPTQMLFDAQEGINVFSDLNESIGRYFQTLYGVRGGAEFRYETFYVRLGGGYQSPLLTPEASIYYDQEGNQKTLNDATIHYSGGIGFRTKDFYVDITFFQQKSQEKYLLYDIKESGYYKNTGQEPVIIHRKTLTSVLMSFGLRF